MVKSDSIASDVDESDLASSQGGSTNSLTGGVDGGHTAKSAGDQQNLVSNEWGDDVFIPSECSSEIYCMFLQMLCTQRVKHLYRVSQQRNSLS